MRLASSFALAACLLAAAPAAAQELIVNGGFEASTSQTVTPTGWTNIGHSDGVIAYSVFTTPAYQGSYYYDLGGFGNAAGPVGDGIMQTVATSIGSNYVLTFGLSSENVSPLISTLTVMIGSQSTSFDLTADGSGGFHKPFVTQTLNYTATGTSTMIRFIETANASGGNNDPLIDGVSFRSAVGGAVPEPATWAMMLAGFGAVGFAMRRRQKVALRFA